MSMRYQAAVLTATYIPLEVPDAPTIGTATAGNAQVSVTFTAPSNVGGGAITSYIVVVTDSSSGVVFTNTGASSPIVVTGLTNGNTYTAKVAAINAYGAGPYSASTGSFTPNLPQQQAYTTPGTYTWVAPAGITSGTVAVVCVGGGGAWGAVGTAGMGGTGGGGGGLGYKNGYAVTAGNSYTVVVGTYGSPGGANATDSYFVSTAVVKGGGGSNGFYNTSASSGPGGSGGTYTGDGGGNGGTGGSGVYTSYRQYGGGGGAGGYAGNGGNGGYIENSSGSYVTTLGGNGSGGAAAGDGNGGGGGGGVGILGQGTSGTSGGSQGGSGGGDGLSSKAYGGGAGSNYGGNGGVGAVRIIWSTSGVTRAFPSTNTGDL